MATSTVPNEHASAIAVVQKALIETGDGLNWKALS